MHRNKCRKTDAEVWSYVRFFYCPFIRRAHEHPGGVQYPGHEDDGGVGEQRLGAAHGFRRLSCRLVLHGEGQRGCHRESGTQVSAPWRRHRRRHHLDGHKEHRRAGTGKVSAPYRGGSARRILPDTSGCSGWTGSPSPGESWAGWRWRWSESRSSSGSRRRGEEPRGRFINYVLSFC